MPEPLLAVRGLSIGFASPTGERLVVRELDLAIEEGQFVGVVGESGSGKTSAALAILNYLPRGGRIAAGDILFRGQSVLRMPADARRRTYGRRIAHVAQDPAGALNPAVRVGVQVEEGMAYHLGLARADARRRALQLLEEVHLTDGDRILAAYPHMLSGGMQQRVCIAMALACDPDLIVLDEPTTGLDAATEMGIFHLLRELKARRRLSLLFISHNLAAVAGMADRVAIMYGGRLMESGPTATVFREPRHRYTQLMLHALPTMRGPVGSAVEMRWESSAIPGEGCPFRNRCDVALARCTNATPLQDLGRDRHSACVRWDTLPPLSNAQSAGRCNAERAPANVEGPGPALVIADLTHRYAHRWRGARSRVARPSLDHVSFTARRGEVLAIIGESGSGKTTLARCLVGLLRPFAGSMTMQDVDLAPLRRYPREIARNLQIVFQNIAGSLHPRKRLDSILERPYRLYENRVPSSKELEDLVHSVGLRSDTLGKLSTRLSGGERQRGALARAFATRPSVIVLDEAFSALDVSMKMKVRNLLLAKKAETDATYLLITHDLPVARAMADRVLVLYQGWVCETGPSTLFEGPPYHPYTETLIWSALQLEGMTPRSLTLKTAPAAAVSGDTAGCRFHARCPRKLGTICEREAPPRQSVGSNHSIECHIPLQQLADMQSQEWRPEPVLEAAQ